MNLLSIIVNGKTHQFATPLTLFKLLNQHLQLQPLYAVALNGVMVPKALYEQQVLNDHDVVDIVMAMEGG